MAIIDLFSKRQKRSRGETVDIFTYDAIPPKLRVQIVHIIREALGTEEYDSTGNVQEVLKIITKAIRQELGVFVLPPTQVPDGRNLEAELFNYFLKEQSTEACLDFIEISFRAIDHFVRDYAFNNVHNAVERADGAIADLNGRLREHGIGYQFADGQVIRIDSELIHVAAVKPALRLLGGKGYAGPHDEFVRAYQHYREGKNKEALNECLKCFESTMKAICSKRNWAFGPGDTARALIDICLKNGLVPGFWANELTALRQLLESSIPTGRNKLSGHGQGATPSSVPEYIVAYMLHMTASTVVFLVNAEKALS